MARPTGRKGKAQGHPAWKTFQDIVARIETIGRQGGAVVRSPDRIADVVSRKSREVDVSIRQRLASEVVLTTVECRRRKDVDDVRWIEQLATKRENLGAALTIAVSAAGFSREAISLAGRKGIALRRLTDLTDDEIKSLLTPVFQVRPQVRIITMGLKLADGRVFDSSSDFPTSIRRVLDQGPDTPMFRYRGSHRLSLNQVLKMALTPEGTRPFDNVPRDGSAVLKEIRLNVPLGTLQIELPGGLSDVVLVAMEVWFYLITDLVPPATALRYQRVRDSGSGSTIRHSEYEIPDRRRPVRITIQHDDDLPAPNIVVEVRDHLGQLHEADLEFIRRGRIKDGKVIEDLAPSTNAQPDN